MFEVLIRFEKNESEANTPFQTAAKLCDRCCSIELSYIKSILAVENVWKLEMQNKKLDVQLIKPTSNSLFG